MTVSVIIRAPLTAFWLFEVKKKKIFSQVDAKLLEGLNNFTKCIHILQQLLHSEGYQREMVFMRFGFSVNLLNKESGEKQTCKG